MKNLMNKFFAAAALVACIACSKVETDVNNVVNNDEKGVYVTLSQIVEDDAPTTRGYASPDWAYNMEVNDRISVWSTAGTQQIFKVVETQKVGGKFVAKIEASGFTLAEGEEYYASYPFVLENVINDFDAQILTYEGQTQTDQNGEQLRELAKYDYSWAKATCSDGKTNFSFARFSTFFRVVATLPREGMTIKEVKVTADQKIFALNGVANMTNGAFTPTGELSESISMTLNNLTVNGKVLTAYFASNPLPAADYVITITDSEGKVYTSESVHKGERIAGAATKFEVTVESEERNYELVTSMPSDPAGKYILVFPNGTTYRAFSFSKTMENAETAAASVATTSFEDLYGQSSDLYNAVVGGNYVEITGEANATTLTLNPEQEAAAALDIAANAAPWTVTAPAKDLQTTLTSGSYSIGVDHLVIDVASDGTADIVAAFNAPNAVAVMNSLRGHDVNVTFQDLINLAITKNDEFTDDEAVIFTKAFNKLVAVVKKVVAENPHNLFPAGSSLMNITLNTNAFEVFSQYHDNVAELSWRISPEKRFGLAQLGYNINAQGFTVSVNLPSHEWFNKLNESLTSSAVGIFPSRDKFVAYWKALDSQYTVNLDGVKIDNFFEKLATRFVAELRQGTNAFDSSDEFTQLYAAAVLGEFTKMGDAYKKLAEKLDTGIQPAYIYKKVE